MSKQSHLSEVDITRKLRAILAADVVGYSRLMGADEQGTLTRLREIRESIDIHIEKQHGRLVGSAGDSLLVEFSSSVDAVNCAWHIQNAVEAINLPLPENQRMEFRIGVNLGDVIIDGPQIYGDGVNIAARLEGLADPGGIAISGSIHEQVHNKLDYIFDEMGSYEVKNIAEPIHVYRVRLHPEDAPPKWRKEYHSKLAGWHWMALGVCLLMLVQAVAYGMLQIYSEFQKSAGIASDLAVIKLPSDLSAGVPFRSCGICPEMTVISDGKLLMGAKEGEPGRSSKEGPQHEVQLTRPIAMGRFEVTFAQWDACVFAGGCNHKPEDRGWGRGNRPVFYVSWEDSREYVKWLRKLTGLEYRLPSEAEWEYAARAGSNSTYWWGDDIGDGRANCTGCGKDIGDITLPVGSLDANPFGLYDVHGNVWEWTADCWNGSYAGAPIDGTSWNTGDCTKRVLRGGAWGVKPNRLRSAHRRSDKLTLRSGKRGFRIALTLPQ